ncbi:hypothetical protein HDV00_007532 [Rhizophlyctis rosea]|nr:hypothetical protein HDV00_007532 [Rhizophlyctis rosea]
MHVRHILYGALVGALCASSVAAQDGGGPRTSGSGGDPFANYKCDPNVCKLPTCRCASTSAPVSSPPQFLLVTFDDAMQSTTMPAAQALIANRKNPNGCPVGATFFVSADYSDPFYLTQWYAAGSEVADHTITHAEPFAGTYAEIEGNRYWATSLGGIPRSKYIGFRHPFLNYTVDSLNLLAKMGFTYESSMSAGPTGDNTWPYTLDYGSVNDCMNQVNVCGQKLNAAGLWEIPMATLSNNQVGLELMDPFNLPSVANATDPATVTADYQAAFDARYNSNRAPFGVYTHPVWLGAAQPPSIPDGSKKLAAVQAFLDYATKKPDVWMVTNAQLIEYMKNPVPAAQLGSQSYMQCTHTPAPPTNICNGLAGSSSLVESCNFANGTIRTCYGCPSSYVTLQTPSTDPVSSRCRLPNNCDTLYWDPVGCKCLCTAASCAFTDTGRNISLDPSWMTATNGTGSNGKSGGSGSSGSGTGKVVVGAAAMVLAGLAGLAVL